MKRLFFGIILSLGSFLTACAQDKEDKKLDPIIVNTANVAGINFSEDHFSSIEPINLPIAVQNVVVADYPMATIKNAYVNYAEQYKLLIVLKDGRSGHLYADRDGNWIER